MKENRYDAERWTGNEADAGEENIIRSDHYRREKNEMEKKKKIPLPDAECPFSFFRVRGEQRPLQMTTVVLSAQ